MSTAIGRLGLRIHDANRTCAQGDSTHALGSLGLLATLQLADSAFPAGLYAFSHGLETAVQEGHIKDADGLEGFVSDWLAWQVGPGDAVVVAAAHRAARAGDLTILCEIDGSNAATKLPREAREASQKTGTRLLATAVLLLPDQVEPAGAALRGFHGAVERGASPGTYAVSIGAAAAALAASERDTVLAELHGATTSMLSAALRLLRIDHQQTQRILRRLAPLLSEIAAAACAQAPRWRQLRPCAPLAEVLQQRHEAAHVRLFMS